MRRNIAYAKYMNNWWLNVSADQDEADPVVAEGKQAYAMRRARHERDLIATFPDKWKAVLDRANASPLLTGQVIDTLREMPSDWSPSLNVLNEPARDCPLVLMVQGLDGLALSTDDDAYEVTYVHIVRNSDHHLTIAHSWASS
jgi:hypothetical protein